MTNSILDTASWNEMQQMSDLLIKNSALDLIGVGTLIIQSTHIGRMTGPTI